VAVAADLVQTSTGAVYGEVDGLGPGTSRPLAVNLGNGQYAFRCMPEDGAAVIGPSFRVTGARGPGGPAVVPVTQNDLLAPLRTYQAYVGAGLGELAGQVAALRDALGAGDLEGARAAWLPAHLTYERLGAAYGAFGAADKAINGRADGLTGGTADPGFTGFHRLEYGLWHGQAAEQLVPVADRLVADVTQLRSTWPAAQVDPLDLGLRAHEIMENALQFELSGAADYGSGSGLATIGANLDGTAEVLSVLRPLLQPRYPGLGAVDAWMGRTSSLLATYRHPDGAASPLATLDAGQRRRLGGTIGGLVERLAPVAAICEPRRIQ
jgi:iron uptake system component EfeO